MKKLLLVLSIFAVFALGLMAKPTKAAQLPENPPVVGVESTTTDFYSHWQPGNFGAKRIGDQGVAMAMTSGFGLRAGFRTAFNVTDFEMELDLSHMDKNTVAMTFFGPQGSYIGGNGAVLSIEFVKSGSIEGKYLVAVAPGSQAHNESFPQFILAEQGNWEDANWKGYHVVALDHIIKVSIKEVGTDAIVTINGQAFTIPAATFYASFADKTDTHFLVGALNLDNTIQTLVANYVVDAPRRAYYAENGVYDTFKTKLIALEAALLLDLSNVDNVQAAQAAKVGLDIETLKVYDKNFYQARYDAANATLTAAIKELGGDIVLDELETYVVSLETKVGLITNYTTATQALDQLEATELKLSEIDSAEFTPEQLTRLGGLEARITQADTDTENKLIDLVTAQVEAFEASVANLSTIELVNAAVTAQSLVSTRLIDILPAVEKAALQGDFDAAKAALKSATDTLPNWTVKDNTYVVVNNDVIEATFMGDGQSSTGNGLFYGHEKFDVRKFSMTLQVASLTKEPGGWFSFGIMEKTEIFSTADDSSVQENKGLFFLIIPEANNRARVEIYMLSLYSNRFFDAQRTETLNIDLSKDVVIDFSTEMKSVSGVTDEYMRISIGGEVMKNDTITTRSMKTALADYSGYLYLVGTGGNVASKNTIKVSAISGGSPTAPALAKAYNPAPHLVTTTLSYDEASLTDKTVEFYNRDLAFTVKVGNVLVPQEHYTYANNQLKLKGSFLDTLEVGEHQVKIETAGGSVNVALTVVAKPIEPAKSNSAVVIIASLSGVALVAAGAVAFFVIRKRKLV